MKSKIQLIVPILTVLCNCILYSQTVPDNHLNDSKLKSVKIANGTESWKDTVYITEDITIKKDSSLIIRAGTRIIFTGYYKITINGKITAIGTATKPILFTVEDTTGFSNNDSGDGGWGGFYISGNENSEQSRFKYCTIEYCKKIYDDVSDNGGAIKISNHQNIEIKNCILRNNKAFVGGAIYCGNSKITISDNDIYYNQTLSNSGGAFYLDNSETLIVNNVIHHNTAKTKGGAIFIINSEKNLLINNTICNNKSYEKGGGIMFMSSADVHNTILFNNTSREGDQAYIDATIDMAPSFYNCDIQDGQFGIYFEQDNFPRIYENNIEIEPLFVATDTFNFRLLPESPCVDMGHSNIFDVDFDETIPFDKDGKYRRVPGIEGNERKIDIGAYEYNSPSPMTLNYQVDNESIVGMYDGAISLSISGGQEPYSFEWNTGDTTQNLSGIKSGYYEVTIADLFAYEISSLIYVPYDSVIFKPIPKFSVKGKVYMNDTIIKSGIILAFKKKEKQILLDTLANIISGRYFLNDLDSAQYIIQAIPGPEIPSIWLPTFYGNYSNWEEADIVDVYGKVIDLDIRLQQVVVPEFGEKSISGVVLYEDTSSFTKSLFDIIRFEKQNSIKSNQLEKVAKNIPVILKRENDILLWGLSDENGKFKFKNLPEGSYTVEAQKAGLNTTFKPSLTVNDESPVIDDVKIIIRKNDIITTYKNYNKNDFEFSVNLYPSLTPEEITLDFNYYDIVDYSYYLYNSLGRLVIHNENTKPEGESKQILNLSSYAPGYYMIKIKIGNQIIEKTLIKY